MSQLDPRVVTLWRLQGLARLVTSYVPLYLLLGWVLLAKFGVLVTVSVEAALVLLLAIHALAWPTLAFRNFTYQVREHDLLVEQGVLWRQAVCVPRHRIQHVDTRQGPLDRLVGVSRLLVYTAAGLSADGSIPGLDEAVAEKLRDELARSAGGTAAGDDGV
ncbi:MAG: PH domain-containing protein [Deltaproteobacteria bacterium]|nr:PH domain-containing protein [Deltaproteobacteria bacterium]